MKAIRLSMLLYIGIVIGMYGFDANAQIGGNPANVNVPNTLTTNALVVSGTSATVNGKDVCLDDGTNCDPTINATSVTATGAVQGASLAITGTTATVNAKNICLDDGTNCDNTIVATSLTTTAGVNSASLVVTGSSASVNGQNICLANKTNCDYGSAVTDYQRSNVMYWYTAAGESFTNYAITSNVTENATESIGPTGSGADNIWSGLDHLPDDANMIIALAKLQVVANSTNTAQISLFLGHGDDTSLIGYPYAEARLEPTASGDRDDNSSIVFIPLNANQEFAAEWSATNDSTRLARLYLIGFMTQQ